MAAGSDTGALVEVASQAVCASEYERGTLEILRRQLGFDVAIFRRASGCSAHGLDPKVEAATSSRWGQYGTDYLPVMLAAFEQCGVAVDVDVLGQRRMDRLAVYQELMRPHDGKATAIIGLTRGGKPIATLALGRTRGRFADDELDYLRALSPTLAVCESAVMSATLREDLSALALLTPREREVLSYLPLGHTNPQIALALGTTARTVRNQLSSIYEKLEVASRAEAVARCAALGMLNARDT